MARLVVLFFSFGILVSVARCEQLGANDLGSNFVFPEEEVKKDRQICSTEDVLAFSQSFHSCFVQKKYKDGGKDLDNLVGRILDDAKLCIEKSTGSCRPNLKGFVAMMDHVILQVKDHCHIYLEYTNKGKDEIKDFQCVEGNLSASTFESCFKVVFSNVADSPEKKFQQKVEHAISCANKSHKLCSSSAKTYLNQMVRIILRVVEAKKENTEEDVKLKELKKEQVEKEVKPTEEQRIEEEMKPKELGKEDMGQEVKPEKEDIQQKITPEKQEEEYIEEKMNSKPPMKWYDSILQPFITMWRAVRTFFGF